MSEDYLGCSICLDGFNETSRVPLLLSCGHTFCADCIKLIFSSNSKIKCPNCNKEDTRQPKDLQRNYILSDIVLKFNNVQYTKDDPWNCKLHPNEIISYFCQTTKQLLCSECLIDKELTDLVMIDPKEVADKIGNFKSLYEIASPFDLKERASLCGMLSECVEGQKLRILQNLDDAYLNVLQTLENQYLAYKKKVQVTLGKEQNKLESVKDILLLLRDMKTIGTKIENIPSSLQSTKMLNMISSLASINDIGSSSEIKRLASTPMEFSAKIEIPIKNMNVAAAIVETPMNLIRGMPESSDLTEKKLSRFNPPTNRWGIFEGRNQIEAVTFTTNQRIFVTGVGIGNAYHPGKSVKLQSVLILEGGSTTSPIVYEDGSTDLCYDSNAPKVVKIPFKKPVEIKENVEYTIKLIIRGGAGVFRGGSTTRTRNGEGTLVFKFKNTFYGGDDVKNGENADDGPIFDIYYKTALEASTLLKFTRFEDVKGELSIPSDDYLQGLVFHFNKPVNLTGISIGCPSKENSTAIISMLKLYSGTSSQGELIYELTDKPVIPYASNSKTTKISLEKPFALEPKKQYALILGIKCEAVYKGENCRGNILSSNGIIMKTEPFGEPIGKDCFEEGSIIEFHANSLDSSNSFATICIPPKFVETASGETKIERFDEAEKQWHLNSENQVECFSFTFSEDVLLTALGLGNCAKIGGFITLENTQILTGNCSTGPILYNSVKKATLFNHTDEVSKIKVRLENPVKITGNTVYTIRLIMRGEGKSYKGKKCKGATITSADGIVFKSIKARLGGNDKQNGDNEAGGPIFDIYYISLNRAYSIDNYNMLISQLYPKIRVNNKEAEVLADEYKVCRYNNTGSSWHVNADGKQIEAISFKPSHNVKITAIGIGNAHEEGKKVTVGKIQIKEGKSTQGTIKIYKHKIKEKLINVGEESKFVRVPLETPVPLSAESWYTLMIKYKPGVPVCRGTMANNQPTTNGVTFLFEKTKYEGPDVENGSHEVHGPLRDFYFTLTQ